MILLEPVSTPPYHHFPTFEALIRGPQALKMQRIWLSPSNGLDRCSVDVSRVHESHLDRSEQVGLSLALATCSPPLRSHSIYKANVFGSLEMSLHSPWRHNMITSSVIFQL